MLAFFRLFRKAFFAAALSAVLCAVALAQAAGGASKLLPERLGDFRAEGFVTQQVPLPQGAAPEDYGVASSTVRQYKSPDGAAFMVAVIRTSSTSAAYSLLTERARANADGQPGAGRIDLGGAEAVSRVTSDSVSFVKGPVYANVVASSKPAAPDQLGALARAVAASIEAGVSELPVLVLHLPEWEQKVREGVGYAVSPAALRRAAGEQPALDAVPFDGGTEAVTATYGDARLVIVEFPTPQHASDADAAITNRVNELRAAGGPAPPLYKRVGNYSVFVFGGRDEAAAEQLISGVKYEKDVRWLGRNPRAEEIMTRRYTATMGGVLVTTLITTGLAILLCLGVGAVIGGTVFLRRRARQADEEVYSDAGGMLRLNLEELNGPAPSTKLVGQGED